MHPAREALAREQVHTVEVDAALRLGAGERIAETIAPLPVRTLVIETLIEAGAVRALLEQPRPALLESVTLRDSAFLPSDLESFLRSPRAAALRRLQLKDVRSDEAEAAGERLRALAPQVELVVSTR
jgi:hypothetical protein